MDTVGPRQRTRNNGNTTDWGSGMDARACKLLADEAMKEGRTVDHNVQLSDETIFPRSFWVYGDAEIYDFCYGVMRKVPKEIVTQDWVPSSMETEMMDVKAWDRWIMQVRNVSLKCK